MLIRLSDDPFGFFEIFFQHDLVIVIEVDQDRIAIFEFFGQQGIGQSVFYLVLDHPPQRARTHIGIVPFGRKLIQCGIAGVQGDAVFLQAVRDLGQFDIDDGPDILFGQRPEHDHAIQPVDKLRPEDPLQRVRAASCAYRCRHPLPPGLHRFEG